MTDQYSPQDAVDALKELVGIKKDNPSSASIESGDTDIQQSNTHTPSDVLDVPIGAREGKLVYIDPTGKNGFIYVVYFEGTNTSVYARMALSLGITSYTPQCHLEGELYKLDEDVTVSLEAIKDTLKWQITGIITNDITINPGTTIFQQGNSSINLNNDNITLTNGKTVFEITNNWVYLNGRKICIAPCGGVSWNTVSDSIWVWYADSIQIYNSIPTYYNGWHGLGSWSDSISLSNVSAMSSYPTIDGESVTFTQLTGNVLGSINEKTGEITSSSSKQTFERIFQWTEQGESDGFYGNLPADLPVYKSNGVEKILANSMVTVPDFYQVTDFDILLGAGTLGMSNYNLGTIYLKTFHILYGIKNDTGIAEIYKCTLNSDNQVIAGTLYETINLQGTPTGYSYSADCNSDNFPGIGGSADKGSFFIALSDGIGMITVTNESVASKLDNPVFTYTKNTNVIPIGNIQGWEYADGDIRVEVVTKNNIAELDPWTGNILNTYYIPGVTLFWNDPSRSYHYGPNYLFILTNAALIIWYEGGYSVSITLPEENPVGLDVMIQSRPS